MTLEEFLSQSEALGCTLKKSLHKGAWRVTVNDQETFLVNDRKPKALYQFFLPGNSIPTRGSEMTYQEAINHIKSGDVNVGV